MVSSRAERRWRFREGGNSRGVDDAEAPIQYWQRSIFPRRSVPIGNCSRFVLSIPFLSISTAGPLKSRRWGTAECYLTIMERRENSPRARQVGELPQSKNPSWMPSVLLPPPEPIKREPRAYERQDAPCFWHLAARPIRLSHRPTHSKSTITLYERLQMKHSAHWIQSWARTL